LLPAALCYKKSSRWEQVAKDAQTALGLSRDLMKVRMLRRTYMNG
jgi:hypothetical protein